MAYFVYWHKFANSGLWEYSNRPTALRVADELAKQEEVYRVTVLDGSILAVVKDKKAQLGIRRIYTGVPRGLPFLPPTIGPL